jgi:hypothetical protein
VEDQVVTQDKAKTAYNNAREFYKGGIKSSNKEYNDAFSKQGQADQLVSAMADTRKSLDSNQAYTRVEERYNHCQLSSKEAKRISAANKTPLQFGTEMVNAGNTAGNCGEMACVVLHFAAKQGILPSEMWHVTAYNHTTTSLFKGRMEFGHSWAQLGNPQSKFGAVFFADPWAGVFCLHNQYAAALKFQLDKWQRQGKRVHVNWANTSGWMNANDSAILSLTGEGRTTQSLRADQIPAGVLR